MPKASKASQGKTQLNERPYRPTWCEFHGQMNLEDVKPWVLGDQGYAPDAENRREILRFEGHLEVKL